MLVQGRGDTRLFTLGRRACEEVSGQRMWDAGVLISGASDNPVTPFVVTDEIEIGVTRNSPFPGEEDTDMTRWPEQGLTAYQMLEAYTGSSAPRGPGAPPPLRSRGARKEGTAPSLGPFLFACGRVCDCLGPIRW